MHSRYTINGSDGTILKYKYSLGIRTVAPKDIIPYMRVNVCLFVFPMAELFYLT
jgi:hypothetical protein